MQTSVTAIATRHVVDPNQMTTRKNQLLQDAVTVFGGNALADDENSRTMPVKVSGSSSSGSASG